MDSLAHKLINWDAYYKIEELIEKIQCDEKRSFYQQLLEEIWEKSTKIDSYIIDMEFKNHIKEITDRGVKFIAGNKRSISSLWSKLFASSVPKERKKEIFYNNFRWHIFSFGLVEALSGDEARKAFDNMEKENVYIFYQFSDDAYLIENASVLTAADFDIDFSLQKADLYVFDPAGRWTYVHTHEEECGPYFYKV